MVEAIHYANAVGKTFQHLYLIYLFIFIEIYKQIFLRDFIYFQFQFLLVLLHTTINYFSECSYPKGYDIAFLIYGVFIMGLFLNFYKQSYTKAQATKKEKLNGANKKD